MKKAGIVLLCLQLVALLQGVSSGEILKLGLIGLIGYFLPAIIGCILLSKSSARERKARENAGAESRQEDQREQ